MKPPLLIYRDDKAWISLDDLRKEDDDKILLLGYMGPRAQYSQGLIIQPSGERTYSRIGVISVLSSLEHGLIWPGDSEREIVTII